MPLVEMNVAGYLRCGKVGQQPEGHTPHVDLLPGVNNLSVEDWASIKDHPSMKFYLGQKILVDGEKKPAIAVLREGPALANLKGLSTDEACDVAKETLIVETLVLWLNAETRQKVIRILESQLTEKLGVDLKTIDRKPVDEVSDETEIPDKVESADKAKRK